MDDEDDDDDSGSDPEDSEPSIVLGILTQFEQGRWYLEDEDAQMPLELSRAQSNGGFLAENSVVILEGFYDDGVFAVDTILFPPAESRTQTQ